MKFKRLFFGDLMEIKNVVHYDFETFRYGTRLFTLSDFRR